MSGTANFISPYDLGNLLAPVDGTTHAAKINVILGTNQNAILNIASLQQVMGAFQPQSIMVDNTANTSPLLITEQVFGYTLTFPAGELNWVNFPAVNNAIFNFSSVGSINAMVAFFDFPALPFNLTNSSNVASSNVNVTNASLPVDIIGGSIFGAVVYSDASITSSGVSQQLIPANSNRKYLLVGAPSGADIWVNFSGGTAGVGLTGSFKIGAGGFYESNLYVPSNIVTVFCSTANLVIPCTTG